MGEKKRGSKNREVTLDPDDWEKMRALGHRMVDDMITFQQNIRSQQFSFPTKESIYEICTPLTMEGGARKRSTTFS